MAGNARKIGLNIASGFVVSLIGTLPLGYLNLLALQLYITQNLLSAVFFALGVITVEVIAVRLTLLGAVWLLSRKKLMFYLGLFSIAFLLAFALYFFTAKPNALNQSSVTINNAIHPYVLGIIVNSVNFMQYPFWAGWNLYLVNNNKLIPQKPYYYWYLLSTMVGTFSGMMVFILTANYLLSIGKNNTGAWLNIIFGSLFLALALFQSYKLYQKHKATIAT